MLELLKMPRNQHAKLNFMPNVKRLPLIEIELFPPTYVLFPSFLIDTFLTENYLEMFLDKPEKCLIITQHHFMVLKLHLMLLLVHVHRWLEIKPRCMMDHVHLIMEIWLGRILNKEKDFRLIVLFRHRVMMVQ